MNIVKQKTEKAYDSRWNTNFALDDSIAGQELTRGGRIRDVVMASFRRFGEHGFLTMNDTVALL